MKKSMPEYITALSEDKFEVLEEIFEEKYQKFLVLYWLIRNYSDYTTSLKYKSTKKDILKIEMTLTKLKIDKVMEEIYSNIPEDSDILVTNEGKVIRIEITNDESTSQ